MVHGIAPQLGLHASAIAREVMLACSMVPEPGSQQAAAAAPSVPLIVSIAEWYMATAIKDNRGLKVSISRAR